MRTSTPWGLTVAACAAATAVALAACSDAQVPAGLQGAPMVVADGQGVCGLLARGELELALNTPLDLKDTAAQDDAGGGAAETATARGATGAGTATQRSAPDARRPSLLPGMTMCGAGTGQDRVVWGALSVDDADEALDELFERYRAWHGDYLQATRVDGHPAVWDAELATLLVVTSDHAVGVRINVTNPPVGAGADAGDDDEPADSDGSDDAVHDDAKHDDDGGAQDAGDLQVRPDPEEATYQRQQAGELARRALRRL